MVLTLRRSFVDFASYFPKRSLTLFRLVLSNKALETFFFLLPFVLGSTAPVFPKVRIAAAISLKKALAELAFPLEKKVGGKVGTIFGASGILALQIEKESPVDLFISANDVWIERLVKRQKIDRFTVKPLLRNQLVLISRPDWKQPWKGVVDPNAWKDSKLALGDPDFVPAGAYGLANLAKLGLRPATGRLVLATHVGQVLVYVERSLVDWGIVYYTDTLQNDKVNSVFEFKREEGYEEAVYFMGAVKGRFEGKVVKAYEFLISPEAAKIFSAFGFKLPLVASESRFPRSR